MKAPIMAAQAMQHPAVVEVINTLSQIAEGFRAKRDALQAENERLKAYCTQRDAEFDKLVFENGDTTRERDALAAKLVPLTECAKNLMDATEDLMTWHVKNVKVWSHPTWDVADMRVKQLRAAIDAAKGGQHEGSH